MGRTGVQILKRALETPARHIAANSAVDGGVAVDRMLAGNPPAAVQPKGPGIQEWAKEGSLNDVEDVASAEKWDSMFPPTLANIMKYEG